MHDHDLEARQYAWNWFAMHAGQRLQLVNFWLVATAFLAAAFVQAYITGNRMVAIGVSAAGLLASLAFQRLDARTRQLVHVAEIALRHIEADRTSAGVDMSFELVRASSQADSWIDSYRTIIQGLQLSIGAAFGLALAYSVMSL